MAEMKEYVAKSVLKKELDIANLHSGIVSALQNIVDEIPAADVQEVRHGTWCGTVCSACEESSPEYYDFEYCPKCGAKMDGAQSEGKLSRSTLSRICDEVEKSVEDIQRRNKHKKPPEIQCAASAAASYVLAKIRRKIVKELNNGRE